MLQGWSPRSIQLAQKKRRIPDIADNKRSEKGVVNGMEKCPGLTIV